MMTDPISGLVILGWVVYRAQTEIGCEPAPAIDTIALMYAPQSSLSIGGLGGASSYEAPSSTDLLSSAVATETRAERAERLLTEWQAEGGALGRAADEAKTFWNGLPGGMPIPALQRGESGSVALIWRGENFYADVEFLGDGVYSIFTRAHGAQEEDAGFDNFPLGEAIEEATMSLLAPLAPNLLSARRLAA